MRIESIAFLAPVAPFRGGIAQHASMLINALSNVIDVRVFSYRRLFPRLLYPGEFQQDVTSGIKCEVNAKFSLDTLNPLSWFRVAKSLINDDEKVVIIPWWTVFLAPCYLLVTAMLRRKGISIIFICHNFSDHEAAWWKRWLSVLVLKQGDGYLVHAESIRRDIRNAIPDASCVVAPMPIHSSYPTAITTLPRRAKLELLFFGFVRNYKGLDVLLHSLAALDRQDWSLSVVGECWGGPEEYLQLAAKLRIEDRVEFVFRYVSESEAASYIDRADLLVLPYRSATGSAVVPLAYRYNKPVVVTPVGGLPEVVQHGVTGFILPDVTELALTAFLEDVSAQDCKNLEAGILQWKAVNSWERLASTLLEFSSEVCEQDNS